MNNIELNFIGTTTDWKNTLKCELNKLGLKYTSEMLDNMCAAINIKLTTFLIRLGYRPNLTHTYRVGLAKRIGKYGLAIKINTNSLFFENIVYFVDTSYTNGFDVNMVVDNVELATKDMLFFKVGNPISFNYEKDYAEIKQKTKTLQDMLDNKVAPERVKTALLEISAIVDNDMERKNNSEKARFGIDET